MLDDINKMKSIDRSGMLDIVADFPRHIIQAIRILDEVDIQLGEIEIDNVLIVGMGGSAISGDIIREWLRDKSDIPIYVNRDYNLPRWVNRNTLSIFLSYSGNTEETLSSFREAIDRESLCVSVSSGGKLEELSRRKGIPHIKIPSHFQPRSAIAFLLFPTLRILERVGLIDNMDEEIEETVRVSSKISENNKKEVNQQENMAKRIAIEIKDTFPNIYGWRYYVPVAKRWKTQINENSKMMARFEEVPESNHNDIVGWTEKTEITALSSCILLRDRIGESERISARYEFMKEIFTDAGAKVLEIHADGKSLLSRMISLLYIGDFVSCYLAILKKVDPTPVEMIQKLKKLLSTIP